MGFGAAQADVVKPLEVLLKVWFKLLPMPLTDEMIPTAINAANNPYSIAVAPSQFDFRN